MSLFSIQPKLVDRQDGAAGLKKQGVLLGEPIIIVARLMRTATKGDLHEAT